MFSRKSLLDTARAPWLFSHLVY